VKDRLCNDDVYGAMNVEVTLRGHGAKLHQELLLSHMKVSLVIRVDFAAYQFCCESSWKERQTCYHCLREELACC
jgi:hypothetical protein